MMDARIRRLNQEEANPRGRYVLYRCARNRRVAGNHALLFAAGEANRMQVALLVSESLSCDYPYANDRLHTFLLEGVSRTAADLRKLGAGYVFELARRKGEKSRAGEWETGAAAVVVDDHPLDNGNGVRYPVCAYAVDSSCVVPAHCIEKQMYAAYALRPRIRRLLPQFLKPAPPVTLSRRFRGPVPPIHTEVTARNVAELVAS